MTTLFFDLGNVLIFFSRKKMYDQLARLTSLSPLEVQECLEDQLFSFETGEISSFDLYAHLSSKTPESLDYEEIMTALSDIFIPNLEIFPVVKELKAKGHRLVLLSNTNEKHVHFIRSHYDILDVFDKFILSYEVGACKPHPLIYQRALQEAQGKTFYTDDIPAYIAAGRKAGLDAELFINVALLKEQLKARKIL